MSDKKNVAALAQQAKEIEARKELDVWKEACRGCRPTDLHLIEAYAGYIKQLTFFMENAGDDKKKAFKNLNPDIRRFAAYSTHGNVLAAGVVTTASNNMQAEFDEEKGEPVANKEIKTPPYARAEVAMNKPGSEIRVASDDKNLKVTFPDAKGKIELKPANRDDLYKLITAEDMDTSFDRNVIPLHDDNDGKDTKADALSLPKANFGFMTLNTAPGVRVNLKELKGTKETPIDIRGMDNADYVFSNDSTNIKLTVARMAGTSPKLQDKALIVVPVEAAAGLKVTQTYSESTINLDPGDTELRSDVALRNDSRGLDVAFTGRYLKSPELEADFKKRGQKLSGVNGTLRIMAPNGKDYVDIDLMKDSQIPEGNFAKKPIKDREGKFEVDGSQLQKKIDDAVARLKGMTLKAERGQAK